MAVKDVVRKFCADHAIGVAVFTVYMIVIWVIAFISQASPEKTAALLLIPRTPLGLLGIFTTIICHANIEHVAVNSLGLIVLSFALLYVMRGWREWAWTTAFVVIVSGLFTWAIGRDTNDKGMPVGHCGASGMLFGHFTYLLVAPLIERPFRWKSLAVSIVTGVLYGGLVFGIFSSDVSVSWEGHLGGALAGVLWAVVFFFCWPRFCRDRCTCCKGRFARFQDAPPVEGETPLEELAGEPDVEAAGATTSSAAAAASAAQPAVAVGLEQEPQWRD